MFVHVAVAVIEDAQGRVLLSRRHGHLHQGGLWEFPGGKLEPGESIGQALRREVHEELGLAIQTHRPLIQIHHDYGDRRVLLDVHLALDWTGHAEGREGQALRWVRPEDLDIYPMPAADRPIVSALRLPDRYLIATPDSVDAKAFRQRLEQALLAGIRLVQFRPTEGGEGLLSLARELCQAHSAQLLLNSRLEDADPNLGLHLRSGDLMRLVRRPEVAGWVAASCHNAEQLAKAAELGLDFAVLSPVLPTQSHPQAQPLGWVQFSNWVAGADLPVYALGGVGPTELEQAWANGAQGIAGIRRLW